MHTPAMITCGNTEAASISPAPPPALEISTKPANRIAAAQTAQFTYFSITSLF